MVKGKNMAIINAVTAYASKSFKTIVVNVWNKPISVVHPMTAKPIA